MELNVLYNIAEKEKIKIYDWEIENVNGMYLEYKNNKAIAINYNKLDTVYKEKCTLSEELGHYYMNATYPASCKNKTLIDKQEYRAKKWSYTILIPYDDLKSAIKNGINNLYSLADYFEVTVEYMQKAVTFYKNKYGYIY